MNLILSEKKVVLSCINCITILSFFTTIISVILCFSKLIPIIAVFIGVYCAWQALMLKIEIILDEKFKNLK